MPHVYSTASPSSRRRLEANRHIERAGLSLNSEENLRAPQNGEKVFACSGEIPSYPRRLTAYVANGDRIPANMAFPLAGAVGAFIALVLLVLAP